MAKREPGTIVVGVGNPDRGDDAAGRLAARALRGTLPRGVEVLEHDGEATSLLACLETASTAYLIDACASGAPAGTLRRLDAAAAPLPQGAFNLSSHGLGLAEAIELARSLGQLPARCILYAIEAGSFEPGSRLTPAVEAAVEEAGERVRDELCGDKVAGGRAGA